MFAVLDNTNGAQEIADVSLEKHSAAKARTFFDETPAISIPIYCPMINGSCSWSLPGW